MKELTRRTVLRRGLGAGLAVAFPSLLTATSAVGAATNRVRLASGSAYGASRTALPLTFSAPAAGNLLLAVLSIDGPSGGFRVPSGWRLAFQRAGTSLSLVAMYRVATGTETSATLGWTTASPGGSWIVAEYSGIDGTDPLGPVGNPSYSDTARTSLVINPAAAEAPSIQLAVLAIDAMNSQSTGTEFRPAASGWDWIATSFHATQPSCPATALSEHGSPLVTGQDLPGVTFRWSRSDQVIGANLKLNTGSTGSAGGTLVSRWVGAVTAAGATVVVKVTQGSTARLLVSPDPELTTGVVRSPAVIPDANGMARLVIAGLASDTRYHYRVEVGGVVNTTKTGSFRTGSTAAGSFTFAFGSCCSSVGVDTFRAIRDHDPDLFFHLGDLHYGNIATNDPAAFRSQYDAALASAHQGPLYANVPTTYTWSDHDFGADGSNRTTASRPAAQSTYRQYVPSHPLPSQTGGIYQTFAYRRVRFIVTDNRSYKSPQSATDDASKTMLGAEQKQWFKNTISAATEPVIVWVNENPWIAPAARSSDNWGGYHTERTELAGFIAAQDKQVAIISGDMHALAADDGSHSAGGIPVFHAAALKGGSSLKGGPYSHGPYPATAGVAIQQYGVMRVLDTGTQIALQFTGYRVGAGAQLSYTHTFAG